MIIIDLSRNIIKRYVAVTTPEKITSSSDTVNGTVVSEGDVLYVQIDGSSILTPVSSTIDIREGDRVLVLLKNHEATVIGSPTSATARLEELRELETGVSEFETILADKVGTSELVAIQATIEELNAKDAEITGKLTANEASIEALEAENATINGKLTAYQADIEELQAETAKIDDLEAEVAKIEDLEAETAKIGQLESDYAEFKTATADNFSAINGTIENLDATYATIDQLEVEQGRISVLETNSLTADSAEIKNLQADVADIDTLIFGSAGGTSIQTEFANAVIAQLGNAQIKSAMIDNVSASKITSGDILTNNVRVLSEDGKLLISDETIQISDSTRVRVQIGKDASNDYSINIWDASGKLMFSKGGITDAAIKDAIIRDDMVSDTANISAKKLNISSLFTEINNSTETINSNKVFIDTDAGTLDVAFVKMESDINDISEDVKTQGTALSVVQGQISSKIWMEDIENVDLSEIEGSISTLETQYSTLNQTVSGISATVGQHTTQIANKADNSTVTAVSAKVTEVEADLDGFKTSVSNTYQTKDAMSGYSTTAQMNSAIEQSASSITQSVSSTYATKTDLSATDTKASNAATAASNAATAASNAQKEVDAVETRMTSAETKIAQNESAISLRATKTELTTVSNAANAAQEAASNAQNTADAAYNKTVSKGEQLVVNGSGLMGDNTNFSKWTFDGSTANNSTGSFTYASGKKATLSTDEFFPINPEKTYQISIDAKSQNGLSTLYSFLDFYDADKLQINVKTHVHNSASTTTLARDLKSGDTVIYLTDASGWSTTYSYGFYMAIWNYTNSFGYTYPAGTYTRNRLTLPKTSGNKLDSNCINYTNHTITLASAYSGATIPAGTSVSQGGDAATYKYGPLVNNVIPTTWKTYTGSIGGVDISGTNAAGKFPPAVAYCKIGFLWNNNTAADQTWITNIVVTDTTAVSSAQKAADDAQNTANGVKTDLANNYYTKTQTDAQIKVSADAITSTVSKTYQTKDAMSGYSTTEQMNSAINQKADSITQTVSSTYATKTALSQTDTKAANAATAASNAQKEVDAVETRMSNAETKIAQTESDILLRATKTEVEDLSGRVDKAVSSVVRYYTMSETKPDVPTENPPTGINITWDGVYEGREYVEIEGGDGDALIFCKVSDDALSADDMIGRIVTVTAGGETVSIAIPGEYIAPITGGVVAGEVIVSVTADSTSDLGVEMTRGLWFMCMPYAQMYVVSLSDGTSYEGDSITWDGDTTGVPQPIPGLPIYKVSSFTPSIADVLGQTLTLTDGADVETIQVTEDVIVDMSESGAAYYVIYERVIVALTDTAIGDAPIPAGTYFGIDRYGKWVSELTLPGGGVTWSTTESSCVGPSSITWDGDTTGLERFDDVLYKVSDRIFREEDLIGQTLTVTSPAYDHDESITITSDMINVLPAVIGVVIEDTPLLMVLLDDSMGLSHGTYFLNATSDSGDNMYVSKLTVPGGVGSGSIYYVDCTTYMDGSFSYSEVNKSLAKDAADSVKNDLATNYYTKTETDAQIQVSADAIISTVSETYQTIDAMSGYSTTAQMNSAIQQSASSITSSVSSTINNLEIGDRNLLLNSGTEVSNNEYVTATYTPSSPLVSGETYTITVCLTPAEKVTLFWVYLSKGNKYCGPLTVSGTDKQTLSLTFTAGYTDGKTPDEDIGYADIRLYRRPNDDTVTGNSTIHWAKCVKGNKSTTEWTPAPEDVDASVDAVSEVTEGLVSDIENITGPTGLIETLSTKVNQTDSEWRLSVNQTNENLSATNDKIDGVQNKVNSYETWFSMTDDGFTIGKTVDGVEQPLKVRLDNDSLDFLDGDVVVAYVSNEKLMINAADVNGTLDVGGFRWSPRSNGNMGLMWIGG